MSTILELNDQQITLWNTAGELLYSEPCAAAYIDDAMLFGLSAAIYARSRPQQFNHRYFSTMSAQPLPAKLGPAQNHADLIYHHLQALPALQDQDIVLGVPSQWSNEQLGLLLGICNESALQVKGFVDISLAHALSDTDSVNNRDTVAVLDIELHRLVLTEFRTSEQKINLTTQRVWEGRGYTHIVEGWMSLVADEYVQRTRFDPLHSGGTEQQVLEQLEAWVVNPSPQGIRTRVEKEGEHHEIEVQADLLQNKLAQRMGGLDLPEQLAITHRVSAIPGLQKWLSEQSRSISLLAPRESVARNYHHAERFLNAENITRLTGAPLLMESNADLNKNVDLARDAGSGSIRSAATKPVQATHLLSGHNASPIAGFAENIQVEGDAPATSAAEIHAGTRVTVNGVTYLAITVQPISETQ